MLLIYTLAVLLAAVTTFAVSISPRSIQRSGKTGDVSLVEFAVHSTIHGRCNYNDKSGRKVQVIYEDTNGKIAAKSLNPSVVDAVAAVKECRTAAVAIPQVDEPEGRTGALISQISPYEINARFNEFARTNYENQKYVQQLQPRILTWIGKNFGLGNLGSFSQPPSFQNNFGLSWGNADTTDVDKFIPGINLVAPNTVPNQHQHSISYGSGNPFDFLHGNVENTGPWGVLNSLKQGGGHGGFPSFFRWLHPFSFFTNPSATG